MPIPQAITARFHSEQCYHVICKSIDRHLLFVDEQDKYYFLRNYEHFLVPFVRTLSHNVLDNHLHLIIKVRSDLEIFDFLSNAREEDLTITQKKYLSGEYTMHDLIKQQFNRLFITYTKCFNKNHNRKGHLFNRPFKRIEVVDENHLIRLFVYIHANTLKHGFFKDFKHYPWSSYQVIVKNLKTFVDKELILEIFGGLERFIELHDLMSEVYESDDFDE